MEQKIDNQLTNCNMEKYIGGNEIINYNITMYQESERKFIVTHDVNTKPVSYFTGRKTELQELRNLVETGQKSVLVSGMGGIGKTSICRKLFDEYESVGECGFFRHIGYIEYNGNMESSLQKCLFYKKQENPEANKEAAWRELEYLAADGKLLLFVDNVNVTMKEDEGLKRLRNIPGAVVLTSRRTSFSKEFKTCKIGFLDVKQCKIIYEKIRYKDSGRKVPVEEIPDLEYIIEKLTAMHTITVEFLAHLAWTKHWTVKKLRYELEEKGFQLEYKDEEDGLVNIQKSYETLYDLSKLTKAEQNILEAFSVFPYIPLAAETCNEWLLADAGVSEDDDILTGLYRKGWLQFDMEHESYSLHPVFAKFIYEKCRPGIKTHHRLIEACQKCLKVPQFGPFTECQKYIPFAENIIEKMDMEGRIEQAKFIDSLAFLLYHMGEYKKSEGLFKKVLLINAKILGKEHPDTYNSYNDLQLLYEVQGKYKEAEELRKKAFWIKEGILGKENPSTSNGYNRLAFIYRILGEYEEAEELHKKALLLSEKELNGKYPSAFTSYKALAFIYNTQGKYEEAEEMYKKALLISEKVLGEEHPFTVSSYNDLAGVYYSQWKYEEAEEMYKKALLIFEKVLGEEHPDTASSYNDLALLYKSQGKYKEAEELYKKALLIFEKVLGKENSDAASSYNNLAGLYESQGKYKISLSYYCKAYTIFLHKLGVNHPNTQKVYKNFELAYMEYNPEGDFEQWLEEKMKETEYQ